jgi:hypothetical protein
MRAVPWVAAALLLAGCATSAVIKSSVGAGSPFCNQLASFATQAASLNDAAGETQAQLLQVLPGVVSSLNALGSAAPANDTVNGKLLKNDIATLARVDQDLIDELKHNSDVRSALATVNAKDGQALTDAAGRFDDYSGSVCSVKQATPNLGTSSSSTTSTTGSPTGPTAP